MISFIPVARAKQKKKKKKKKKLKCFKSFPFLANIAFKSFINKIS